MSLEWRWRWVHGNECLIQFQNGSRWAPEDSPRQIIPEEVRPRKVLHLHRADHETEPTGSRAPVQDLQRVLGVVSEALHSVPIDKVPQVSGFDVSTFIGAVICNAVVRHRYQSCPAYLCCASSLLRPPTDSFASPASSSVAPRAQNPPFSHFRCWRFVAGRRLPSFVWHSG